MNPLKDIIKDGLWKSNPATVQLLGLCPLLAVSGTVVNALGLGIATMLVLITSNLVVSLIRDYVRSEIRIPVFVVIIAVSVTLIKILMLAYFYDLYLTIGLFVALITTNCVIIARAEAFASKNNVFHSIADGFFMGLGFTLVLVVLGTLREIISYGTLFQQMNLLFGESASWLKITLFENYDGFLLSILPPGAFLGLGFIIALKNVIDNRQNKAAAVNLPQTAT
ncbi:Electron transport complex protein RnfE [hydrothermal vent metagenome]|uniref:Electron transport complex protein RnfE n=1 Tax=hydrothermal vent metagenome TaxID=652676 RepID=A0A3B1A6Z2_9ZZZZ